MTTTSPPIPASIIAIAEQFTNADVRLVEEIDARATAEPWELWTSNSFRRITGPDRRDGGVISAVQSADGQPDLCGYNLAADLDFIIKARSLLPRAARCVARLRAEIADTRAYTGKKLGQLEHDLGVARSEIAELAKRLAEREQEMALLREILERAESRELHLHAENAELRDQIDFVRRESTIFEPTRDE